MGWTSLPRDKGITNYEFFNDVLGADCTIVEHATIGGVFYAAVQERTTQEVWGYVALTLWTRDVYNFSYKHMDETVGPGAYDAPSKVLNALTPTDHKYALSWRAQCRKQAEHRRKVNKALRGIPDGSVITLDQSLCFTDGSEHDTFVVALRRDSAGRNQVTLTVDGWGYRVPRWRNRVVSVIRDGEYIDLAADEVNAGAA